MNHKFKPGDRAIYIKPATRCFGEIVTILDELKLRECFDLTAKKYETVWGHSTDIRVPGFFKTLVAEPKDLIPLWDKDEDKEIEQDKELVNG